MTFKETDFPGVIEGISRMSKGGVHTGKLLEEALKINGQIPIYPGIITMCLNSLMEEVKPGDLRKGDTVVLKMSGGEEVMGIVDGISKGGDINLVDAVIQKKEGNFKAAAGKTGAISRMKKDILEKTWPSLVFRKKNDE